MGQAVSLFDYKYSSDPKSLYQNHFIVTLSEARDLVSARNEILRRKERSSEPALEGITSSNSYVTALSSQSWWKGWIVVAYGVVHRPSAAFPGVRAAEVVTTNPSISS